MEELSIEEKAKRYDEVSQEVKDFFEGKQKMNSDVTKTLEHLFPELKESEDERVRKELIDAVQGLWNDDALPMPLSVKRKNEWLAWLKKQGEQKPAWSEEKETTTPKSEVADKIEPRFKVGDWVVANYSGKIGQVVAVSEDGYGYQLNDGLCFGVSWCDIFHLWSIKNDARDGDVLVHNSCVFIFMGFKDGIVQAINEFFPKPTNFGDPDIDDDYRPATKEQRDLLKKAMTDAGYTFDFEKKEMKEIAAPKSEAGDDKEDEYYYP